MSTTERTPVTLADCCQEISQRIDSPSESGYERFVGLEHLDPGEALIHRWGDTDDVTSSMKIFKAGDVIVARRNVYLRRAARADFDGVCSGDGIVLRPRGEGCLGELLPFILNTDAFWDYVISQADGSMSKRITVKRLMSYEFDLPPLDEQHRMVKVLQTMETTVEAHRRLANSAESTLRSAIEHLYSRGLVDQGTQTVGGFIYPAKWPIHSLEDLASVDRGRFSHRPRNLPEFFGGPYGFAQTGDIAVANGYLETVSQYLSEEGVQYSRSFPPGSVLLTIAAIIGKTAITETETWAPDSVVGIVPSDQIDVRFLEFALRRLQPILEQEIATTSTQKNINLKSLRPLPIPCPDATTQQEVIDCLEVIETGWTRAEDRVKWLADLRFYLINQCLDNEDAA